VTTVRQYPDPDALGKALALEITNGIEAARVQGRRYVLGCPGGRSARSTFQALAGLAAGADLRHLVIAMMDEYLVPGANGSLGVPRDSAHYSCRRFALEEIVEPLTAAAARGIDPDHVWLPDPADPDGYESRLADAGGVDLFIVASGASDGHVAFLPPGTALDSRSAIVQIADTTRRDNLATFPEFRSLEEVPRFGVSVGLGTIVRQSRRVVMVMHGAAKRDSAARVLAASDFDLSWPATFIHRCPDPGLWLDAAAYPGDRDAVPLQGPA
jgi:glucosamine-6-phosphate deaminase